MINSRNKYENVNIRVTNIDIVCSTGYRGGETISGGDIEDVGHELA